MTDFFSRLAERALSIALTIQPMIAPLYAPEPQQIEDGVLEMLADETQEVWNTPHTTPTPTMQDTQLSAALPEIATRPAVEVGMLQALTDETQRKRSRPLAMPAMQHTQSPISPPDIVTKPAQRDNTQAGMAPLPTCAPLILERETHTVLQPYPVLQRDAQLHVAITEQHLTTTTTQNINNNERMHAISYSTLQNTLLQTETIEQHHEHIEVQAPSLPKQSEQHLAITGPTPNPDDKIDKREALVHVTHTIHRLQDAVGNSTNHTVHARNRQNEQYEQHMQGAQTIKEAQATPTIQVTIGRIEVRATTIPIPNVQPQRQQVAPAVMSLDDYLRQRAKGGH